jgi:hypothetical protein
VNQIRKRLTYANVMSSIAVFLVLGGATAFAASQLGRNSVGSKQLKRNAVTAAKIKKNAVTKTKIKKGSVDSSKVADGSLTGADLNAGSTPFSQIVYKARGTASVSLPNGGGGLYPLGNPTYTQAANRDDMYVGALDVTIQSTCTGTRSVVAYILVDPANPAVPTINDVVATGQIEDKATGTVNRRLNLSPYITGGVRFQSPTPSTHTLYIATQVTCGGGSGVTATFGGIDVLGTT